MEYFWTYFCRDFFFNLGNVQLFINANKIPKRFVVVSKTRLLDKNFIFEYYFDFWSRVWDNISKGHRQI